MTNRLPISISKQRLLVSMLIAALALPLVGFAILFATASLSPGSSELIMFGGHLMTVFYLPIVSVVDHAGASGNAAFFCSALAFWWVLAFAVWYLAGGRVVRSHEAI